MAASEAISEEWQHEAPRRPPSLAAWVLAALARAAVVTTQLFLLLPLLLLAALATLLAVRWLVAPPRQAAFSLPLHFDYLAAAPTAAAQLLTPAYLAGGWGRAAPRTPPPTSAYLFPPGQRWDVSLSLVRGHAARAAPRSRPHPLASCCPSRPPTWRAASSR